jgi:hypothetical protein
MQFYGLAPVILYNGSGLFQDMTKRFKKCKFILGADALQNMFSPKHLGVDDVLKKNINELTEMFVENKTRFLVVGRNVKDMGFVSASKAITQFIPSWLSSHLDKYEPVYYRNEISSSLLRTKRDF